ncbi:MAG: FAD-dependent oxidoreductase, partial [Planctomycetota bacterium]
WVRDPGGAVPLQETWSGFRDLSPDDRPILGPDPRLIGLHWCCGLGGHGMTLSLGLGRAAASAVLGRPTELATQCTVGRFEFAPA